MTYQGGKKCFHKPFAKMLKSPSRDKLQIWQFSNRTGKTLKEELTEFRAWKKFNQGKVENFQKLISSFLRGWGEGMKENRVLHPETIASGVS